MQLETVIFHQLVLLLCQALNITTHVLKKGGTFVAKVDGLHSQYLQTFWS